MHLIAITSAKGGSARTTSCVRLAKALTAMRIPTGIIDITPYPSAPFLLSPTDQIPVIQGRAARTPIAARSVIKPYEDRCRCLLLDTTRLDDPNLHCWLAMVGHVLITMKVDRNSVRAMPSVWESLDSWKGLNPDLKLLGFLPVCVEPGQQKLVSNMRQKMPDEILSVDIPWNDAERLGPELAPQGREWELLAGLVAKQVGLKPQVVETPKSTETGLISRVWKLAASVLGPRASVLGTGRN